MEIPEWQYGSFLARCKKEKWSMDVLIGEKWKTIFVDGWADDAEALAHCIASIVESLKSLGYMRPHYAEMVNECGELILASSPDGKTHFAIQVRTWKYAENKK